MKRKTSHNSVIYNKWYHNLRFCTHIIIADMCVCVCVCECKRRKLKKVVALKNTYITHYELWHYCLFLSLSLSLSSYNFLKLSSSSLTNNMFYPFAKFIISTFNSVIFMIMIITIKSLKVFKSIYERICGLFHRFIQLKRSFFLKKGFFSSILIFNGIENFLR